MKAKSSEKVIILILIVILFVAFNENICRAEDSAGNKEPGWHLTEYSDDSGNVGLFYSIRDPEGGKLILIDSGNPENAQKVSQVIDENGGYVDAWFLTHYHKDHIGAFNAVYEQYKDRIGQIFVTPVDYELYLETARDWDQPEVLTSFLEITEDAENIIPLRRGNTFTLYGLDIQVFNAFDDMVLEKSTDIHNDCSLVFKISTEQTSVLFLGDLCRNGVELGQYIIDIFGAENVRADYIQAGHHGNWGLPVTFYEQLMPEEMFLDALEWVLTGEKYDAKDLLAWCEDHDIITHDYRQAPTSVILR